MLLSGKIYYICWTNGEMEVVHPRQLRKSDKILFSTNSEIWWAFENKYCSEIYKMSETQLKEKFMSFRKEYLTPVN